jgi:hypothetical protein
MAIVAGDGAIAAGMVLRALAAGCPVLPAGRSRRSCVLADWLSRHGCLPATARDGAIDVAARLEPVLDRDVATRHAVDRGRALAARHAPHSISSLLVAGPGASEAAREVA